MKEIDVLAFCAHPDDVELACGGTVAKLTREGKLVAIVDLTAGELGTRGSAKIRHEESLKAAVILGASSRICLGMPDGNIQPTEENIIKVIQTLRQFRPKAILMPPSFERHPDHETAHRLIRTAMFKSGLQKVETNINEELQERYRIRKMYAYMQSYTFEREPDFYIDISDTFEIKMEAIRCYSSQVHIPGQQDTEPVTRLSRPEFIEELEARAIYFGSLVGVRYAEPFCSVEPLIISNLSKLL